MHARLSSLVALPLFALLGACSSSAYSQPAETQYVAAGDSSAQSAAPAEAASVEHMLSARSSGKARVPVDVRYSFSSPPATDQSARLQLAFIPRVAGQNLHVEFPASDSVTVQSDNKPTSFALQKAEAQGIYRHELLITPRNLATEIRVLVSLDVAGGRYFGIFSIPLAGTPAAAEQQR